ncbi:MULTISPECIES: CD20-like domain-containing protein [Microbacterium]|nr:MULTISPECIES: CD20-like domain-containing protein [Microbacterium]
MSDPQSPAAPEGPVPPVPPAAYPAYPSAPDASDPTIPQPHAAPGYTTAGYGAPGYAAPGYPTPGAPAPGYPTPGYPAPGAGTPGPQRPKTLAIIALVLAGIGLVMAFIPFVTWFAGLPLLAAFIMGIVALASKKQGGKGFAIASIAVSVVGWIVSIVLTIASFGILGQNAIDSALREDVTGGSSDTGDSTADEPTDSRQDLAVVETAFGQSTYDASTWWYVVILENPNEDYIFSLASIDVEALDANGTILDSSGDYLTVLAGRTAIVGHFLSVGDGQVVKLDVRGPEAAEATKAPSSETGNFEIAGLTPTTDDYSTTVRGTVTSSFADDQELVRVVVVARNSAGAIIAAESGWVDRLPAGGTAQFEVLFYDPLPADTVYEAYAAL